MTFLTIFCSLYAANIICGTSNDGSRLITNGSPEPIWVPTEWELYQAALLGPHSMSSYYEDSSPQAEKALERIPDFLKWKVPDTSEELTVLKKSLRLFWVPYAKEYNSFMRGRQHDSLDIKRWKSEMAIFENIVEYALTANHFTADWYTQWVDTNQLILELFLSLRKVLIARQDALASLDDGENAYKQLAYQPPL